MILKSKIFENQLYQQNFAVSRVQQLCKLHLYPDLGDKRDMEALLLFYEYRKALFKRK